MKPILGIIGGSGLYTLNDLKNTRLLKKERETCKPEQLNIYNQGFY